jgi:phosphopantothenoylcysteine decarboxylase / phosphopantothenate---cysteine ligase
MLFYAAGSLCFCRNKKAFQGVVLSLPRRVLLIIGGGIAAYKSLELIRELKRRGVGVATILTRAGSQFVTPLSIGSLSGEKVHTELFSLTDELEMGHIELSRSTDLIVVAPATANLMASMANGLAADLATTALLATDKRVLMAPAMNVRMWEHHATQRNLARLLADDIAVVGPDNGEMACGEYGPGRMAEPVAIADAIINLLEQKARPLAGLRLLVTSGPTHEPIDPVRYIANRSSGKQGHAIAAAAARAGAKVTLVSGPVAIADPRGVETVHVETAREMMDAVERALPADIAIFAAAVADWRTHDRSDIKIKKGGEGAPVLALAENPDILAHIARREHGRPQLVVGFAAETHDLIAHAIAKRARKGCDWMLANDVGAGTDVMGGDRNTIHLISETGVEDWPLMSKDDVAERLIARVAAAFAKDQS